MASAGKTLRGEAWAVPLRESLAQAPAATASWMEQHTRLLKSDTHSRVGLLELRGQPCFLKLYLAKSLLQRLGFRLGYGRGIRSFAAALQLAAAGLPVPQPRACLLVPEGMLLLTEGIPASRDLRALWLEGPAEAQKQQLLQAAGMTLAALHCAGFAHGDCKWGNLLWNGQKFFLVDLEAVHKLRPTKPGGHHPRQLRDLARFTLDAEELGVTPDLYQSFFTRYCAVAACSADQLSEQLGPGLAALRKRHRARYGTASSPLIQGAGEMTSSGGGQTGDQPKRGER